MSSNLSITNDDKDPQTSLPPNSSPPPITDSSLPPDPVVSSDVVPPEIESDSSSSSKDDPSSDADPSSDPSSSFNNPPDSQSPPVNNKGSQPLGLWIGLVVAVGFAAFFAGAYMISSSSDVVSNEDLADAMASLETRLIDLQTRQPVPQAGNEPVVVSIDDDPIIGDPNAPINIIEFSDFQCPFCARFNADTLPKLMEAYIDTGKVKLVYRDFPLHNIHPNAVPAAIAAECADEQDSFKIMHDLIFDKQSEWGSVSIDSAIVLFGEYATTLNLDREVFDSCLLSGKYIDEIGNDLNDGRNYGIDGTPGFLIGNDELGYVTISGAQPFEVFQQVIDAQLGT